jgi:hypothetical protein
MKELGTVLDFKAKIITVDEIILTMRDNNLLQGASTLFMLKLNNHFAMELKSTLGAMKHLTQILDAKYNKEDLR